MTDTALADSTRTRQAMVDFTRLANHRLDNMHEILNEDHRSIALMAQRIHQTADTQFAWTNALVYVLLENGTIYFVVRFDSAIRNGSRKS
jgi:hypothetical protein